MRHFSTRFSLTRATAVVVGGFSPLPVFMILSAAAVAAAPLIHAAIAGVRLAGCRPVRAAAGG